MTLLRHRAQSATAAVLLALLVGSCSDSTGPGDTGIPVPTVTGVDQTVVSPGDTITVTGSDFDPDYTLDRVIFNNTLARAKPFDGSATSLSVVVPRNALSGVVSVARAGQAKAGTGPDLTISRGVGDVFAVGGARSVDLATPASAEYLVVPYATGGPATKNHPYSLVGRPAASPAAGASPDAPAATSGVAQTPAEAFESLRWRAAEEVRERVGVPAPPVRRADAVSAAPQEIRSFNVWNTTDPNASAFDTSNYSHVNAELRWVGEHVMIYTDLDTLDTGNLTYDDIVSFGELFDNEVEPSNTKYFGKESDIDNNGKVIMLVTPVVNRLTPRNAGYFIGGFFFSIDLYSAGGGVPSGTTNHAEIFYLLAADPGGTWSDPRSRAGVAQENLKTIVHEYEHLISFSYRLFNEPQGSLQATWLEEGMAHIAEDLFARETGDPSYNTSNEGRGKKYRQDPGASSLEDNAATLGQRGGIYLFLRLLGDRYGNDIYKRLVQSDCVGRECIQNITGEGFYDTVGDFLAAMYLSGTGTSDDPRVNYTSIDLADFGALLTVSTSFDNNDVGNVVRRATGDFFLYSGSATPTSTLSVSTESSDMDPRTVIVRTK